MRMIAQSTFNEIKGMRRLHVIVIRRIKNNTKRRRKLKL